MEFILYTSLVALFYYLVLIFTTNKWIIKKIKNPSVHEGNTSSMPTHMILALNINIICSLFIIHDHVMNYVTFLIGDNTSFFHFMSAGAVIILLNFAALSISFLVSKLFAGSGGDDTPVYFRPILWITIDLLLLKLTTLYYEAYLSTQSFTIL
tara:strand:- start:1375 stop:1833 length:459 start_codon:yes stop_codon:yes gene_type:complete